MCMCVCLIFCLTSPNRWGTNPIFMALAELCAGLTQTIMKFESDQGCLCHFFESHILVSFIQSCLSAPP